MCLKINCLLSRALNLFLRPKVLEMLNNLHWQNWVVRLKFEHALLEEVGVGGWTPFTHIPQTVISDMVCLSLMPIDRS